MFDDTVHQFVTVENDQILWASVNPDGTRDDHELLTDRDGRYVHAWKANNRDTWQVCVGGSRMGGTLTWAGATTEERARGFAKGVRGKFFKTKEGYERAIERALASV